MSSLVTSWREEVVTGGTSVDKKSELGAASINDPQCYINWAALNKFRRRHSLAAEALDSSHGAGRMWPSQLLWPHGPDAAPASRRRNARPSLTHYGELRMGPQRARVLCVDDDHDTCEMVSALLKLIGCDVVTARSADEAREIITGGGFDLYLLDNWLPGGSGVELCRVIRASGDSAPVVFYSGAAYDSDRAEALGAGAQAYLVKPGDAGLLVETVRSLLPPARK